ncbi:GNAT family N-acetyltransferase [Thermosulfurimonas sp. F29]|uniref:GNAT family N-acetyltransferase n=1 Tax=Thermosulfurimonas sp. F29 TaxID=2867247 RepID=UPI001C8375D9|nr:GNAT family N-acetyltransferase [Thermosulfurimonas sp. F29]MBX6422651.1 GNAT family N-acetyltransferase [Thermosulfurimonas sp. F29]
MSSSVAKVREPRLERVTEVGPDQLKSLVALYEAAYRDDELYSEKGSKRIRRYLRWLLRHARGAFWIAWSGEKPVGFLALEELDPVPEIHEIVVAPEWQGRGLAERLMEEALAYLRQRGWRRVALWVGEYNFRAQRFYRRLGFRITDRVGIWLRMEKELQEKECTSSRSTASAVSASERGSFSSGV